VPTFNYFQTAACLFQDDALSLDGVVRVGRALVEESSYQASQLENSLDDITRRGHLDAAHAAQVRDGLSAAGLLAPTKRRLFDRLLSGRTRGRQAEAGAPVAIDYRTLLGVQAASAVE
jgi:hypothetical protein